MSHASSGHGVRGFTVVEVMIVVCIIGIVAAVAVPSYVRARRESRIMKMINDFRIVYDAFGMFAMENGGFPWGWGDVPEPVGEYLSSAKWDQPTALGGRWLYYEYWGTYLAIIDDIRYDPGQNPLAPREDWLRVDTKIDDGNLSTGRFRMAGDIQAQYSLDDTNWDYH